MSFVHVSGALGHHEQVDGGAAAATVQGLTRRYGRVLALDDVTFELPVDAGIVGLLGPNGAGKSTLLAHLATLTRVQEGLLEVLGHDVRRKSERDRARRHLGYLPQRFRLVPSMRVSDIVAYAAWMNGVESRISHSHAGQALEYVGLSDKASQRVRTLSGGQRQRVGIACAIAHRPRLLLLDEATVGIDPVARVQLRRYLRDIARDRVVLLSTHLVEDVVQVCERIIVMNQGRAVYDGPTAALAAIAADNLSPLASPLESAYERLLAPGPQR